MDYSLTSSRHPTEYANYPGDFRGILTEPPGGRKDGEVLYPVTAEFDGTRTRVGFTLIPPAVQPSGLEVAP